MNESIYEILPEFAEGKIFVRIADEETLKSFLKACLEAGLYINAEKTTLWSKLRFSYGQPVLLHYEEDDHIVPPKLRVVAYGLSGWKSDEPIIPAEDLLVQQSDASDFLTLL